MKGFNKMLDAVMNKGTELDPAIASDTDDTIGNFGNIDSGDVSESPAEDKLVLYLDSGVEVHIPVSVYEQMAGAMQPQEPVVSTMVVGDVEGPPEEEGEEVEAKGPKDGTGPLGGTALCPNSDDNDDEKSDSDDSEEADSDDSEEDKKDKKKEE